MPALDPETWGSKFPARFHPSLWNKLTPPSWAVSPLQLSPRQATLTPFQSKATKQEAVPQTAWLPPALLLSFTTFGLLYHRRSREDSSATEKEIRGCTRIWESSGCSQMANDFCSSSQLPSSAEVVKLWKGQQIWGQKQGQWQPEKKLWAWPAALPAQLLPATAFFCKGETCYQKKGFCQHRKASKRLQKRTSPPPHHFTFTSTAPKVPSFAIKTHYSNLRPNFWPLRSIIQTIYSE